MKWETVRLEECCFSISDGDHQPPPKSEKGIPFVTISDITDTNQFGFENTVFVPEEYYNHLDAKRKAAAGDILYSVVGSFGIPVLIQKQTPLVFQRHIAILKPNKTIVDPRFLYYTMLSREFYAKADAVAIGAAQRTISLSALRNIKISLPELSVQHKIADTLSVYDNLIENNQKQIKLLEEGAQWLYKEWFVNLRFPGYEQATIKDGIPEGWHKDRADTFFEITIGKTPPRAESKWFSVIADGIPWGSIADMGNANMYLLETGESLTNEAIKKFNIKIIPPGTIMVSFKLTVGRIAIATTNICTNEAIAHFHIPDEFKREYVYCYLKAFPYDTLGSTSSISKAVNSKIIKAMPFVIPDDVILREFSAQARPYFDLIKNKGIQNQELKEARNRLLQELVGKNYLEVKP